VAVLLLLLPSVLLAAVDDLPQREQRAQDAAVERVAPSVVSIETIGGLERVDDVLVNTGPTTGLIVSPDGYIVSSAFNFAQQPASIVVIFADGSRAAAKLVATDRSRMLTLLKVEGKHDLRVPEVSPPESWRVGQWSIAVGRTFDTARPNVSVGIVSALGRVWGKAVQTDAKISPSNYGGPLVDIHGRVMGVLVPLSPDKTGEAAGVEWYDSGIGFAVPLAHVLKIMPRLAKGKDLEAGMLGVTLKPGDKYADPPVLAGVRPNSPARAAGLAAGDTIVEAGGQAIISRIQLTHQVQTRYAGDRLHLVVLRDGKRLARDVELVDHIEPYVRPFLGILPRRDAEQTNGVVVRYVYPKSPAAEAGIVAGDRLEKLAGQPIIDAQGLAEQVALLEIGHEASLEIVRGDGAPQKAATAGRGTDKPDAPLVVKFKPAAETEQVPDKLPEARGEAPRDEDLPPVGAVDLQAGAFTNECLAYVPESYNPAVSYGVVVWLHAAGEFNRKELLARWKPICEAHDLILLAPQAPEAGKWSPADVAFVAAALTQVTDQYNVDRLRIAAHGYRTGGALAYLLAFQTRELVRGVAPVLASMAGELPENEPEHRLDFFLSGDKQSTGKPAKTLREHRYAVTVQKTPADRYLNEAELAELVRWLDSLDKI
jgi:serine protease Do